MLSGANREQPAPETTASLIALVGFESGKGPFGQTALRLGRSSKGPGNASRDEVPRASGHAFALEPSALDRLGKLFAQNEVAHGLREAQAFA